MKEIPFKIGQGYDLHKLVSNRKLILGGVEIPFEKDCLVIRMPMFWFMQ